MKKEVDFSKGIRGKHLGSKLTVLGAAKQLWAICVKANDGNLVAFKVYRIEKYADSDRVKLQDESGNSRFYPHDWFAPLSISKEISGMMEKAV